MRLGFHYHIPAFEQDGKIYTIAFQGLFIDGLAPHCTSITLFMYLPLPHEVKEMNYVIQSPNVHLVPLMKHYKIPVRILLYPTVRKLIREQAGKLDVMLMRAPTPLLPLIIKDIRGKIPYAFLVVGEMSQHVDSIKQKEWRKSLIRKYVNWNESKQEQLARHALVFANSKPAFDKYKQFTPHCVEIRTTTLKNSDFYSRNDTCLESPVQVLFTGRIEEDKGLIEITEAILRLNRDGISCVLNVVGWNVKNDDTQPKMEKMAADAGLKDKLVFHGFKKAGEELFAYYKSADLFIVASQNNEGFPRTIWEAMAHSVPVLTVPVGSIPLFLKDGSDCLFLKRKNPDDIYQKIKEIISNQELRKHLIRNAMHTVKDVTIEIQSKKMTDELKRFVQP